MLVKVSVKPQMSVATPVSKLATAPRVPTPKLS